MEVKLLLALITLTIFNSVFLLEVEADLDDSDFAKTVKSSYFVDKTLLIKDFMEENEVEKKGICVIAPRKFGKSTIIDMLKKFFTLNGNGIRVPQKSTDNYKLFCQNKLQICMETDFVEKHLAQYPVIHINFSPLKTMTNYDTFLEKLRLVIVDTFKEHEYLSLNSSLFESDYDKALFVNHYSGADELSRREAETSFAMLSRLLFEHFGKKVIVLADDYNSHIEAVLFDNVKLAQEVIVLLEYINDSLFKYNEYLEKAFLTGVIRRAGPSDNTSPIENINDYRWLSNHKFSKYYGLTEGELVVMVLKNFKNTTKQNVYVEMVNRFYGGYNIPNQETKMYSLLSVIQFFHFDKSLNTYWVQASHLEDIIRILIKNKKIQKEIKDLVVDRNHKLSACIAEPISLENMDDIKKILHTKKKADPESVYRLMFDLGLLTMARETRDDTLAVNLHLPNEEVRTAFSRILFGKTS